MAKVSRGGGQPPEGPPPEAPSAPSARLRRRIVSPEGRLLKFQARLRRNGPKGRFLKFLARLRRDGSALALLLGTVSALALPPVHLLPVLLFTVPGLLRLIEGSFRQAAWRAWLFGFGLGLAGLYWITEPILTEAATFWWLVPFAAPLLAFAVAFYTIIPVLCAKLMHPGFGRLLVFSGAWVLSNLLQQFAFSGFPWNFWGTDWTIPGPLGDVFIQPAAIFGVYGLTLCTLILAGLPMFGRRGFVALFVSLAIWAGFGAWRLRQHVPATGATLALVQPGFPVPGTYDRPTLLAHWQRLLNMSQAGLAAGAQAIIWPEASSPWELDSDAAARQQLAAVTGATPVLAGAFHVLSNTDARNALVVTNGPGPALAVYDKWKLVPFGEYMPRWIPVKIIPDALGLGFTPGPGPATLHIPGLPPVAPEICYEDIFTGQIISHRDRPAWMLVITDDSWFGDSAGTMQHFENARLRAVEEGLPLARDANAGISAMFDGFGRELSDLPLNTQGVLIAALPGPLPETLYARLGLIFPATLALSAIAIGLLISRVEKNK